MGNKIMSVPVDTEIQNDVDEFKKENEFESRADALRLIISTGLNVLRKEKNSTPEPQEEVAEVVNEIPPSLNLWEVQKLLEQNNTSLEEKIAQLLEAKTEESKGYTDSLFAEMQKQEETQEDEKLILGALDNSLSIADIGGLEGLLSSRMAKHLNAVYVYALEDLEATPEPKEYDLYQNIVKSVESFENEDFDSADKVYYEDVKEAHEGFISLIDRLTINAINQAATSENTVNETDLMREIAEQADALYLESYKKENAVTFDFSPSNLAAINRWLAYQAKNDIDGKDMDLKTWFNDTLGKQLVAYGKKGWSSKYRDEEAYKIGLNLQNKAV